MGCGSCISSPLVSVGKGPSSPSPPSLDCGEPVSDGTEDCSEVDEAVTESVRGETGSVHVGSESGDEGEVVLSTVSGEGSGKDVQDKGEHSASLSECSVSGIACREILLLEPALSSLSNTSSAYSLACRSRRLG